MSRPPHLTSQARGTYYDSWGTPTDILDLVRMAGPICCDLASSHEANEHVGAEWYLTDALKTPFEVPAGRLVFCNPPGPGKLVARFWDLFEAKVGPKGFGAFLAFSHDHVRLMPGVDQYHLIMLPKRVRYRGAPSQCSFPSTLIVTDEWYNRAYDAGFSQDHFRIWFGGARDGA